MDPPELSPFQVGPWCVRPLAGTIARGDELVRVDDRALRILACLAGRAGQAVAIDDLLDAAWPGVVVGPDSVYQAITTLRRALGDTPREPAFIATVPRQGYRLIAPVAFVPDDPTASRADVVETAPREVAAPVSATRAPGSGSRRRAFVGLAAGGVLVAALATIVLPDGRGRQRVPVEPLAPLRSIAVLPFADLTDGMTHQSFADGMTEQLIETLGDLPNSHVPSRTASFRYRDDHRPVREIARDLNVRYLLEGSVRESGATLRITARLVRVADGYLLWSNDYDRPSSDALAIQDDIAHAVGAALQSCWEANA